MATVEERLTQRLSKVPGVTPVDIAEWVTEAEAEFEGQDPENETALLYLALYLAYETISSDAARFFKYTDGEEAVDKSMIFDNYMKLAKNARRNYSRYLRGGFGASQTHLGRADDK